MKMSLALFAATAMIAGSVQAGLLVYEPFDDSDPSLNGNTSGTGFSSNWSSGGWGVTSGSYAYGTLKTSGNKSEISAGRTGSSASITKGAGNPLFDAGLLNDGATLWFSTLILSNPTPGNGNMDYGFALGSNGLSGSNNVPMNDAGDGGQGVGFSLKSGQIRASMWDAADGTGVERSTGLSFTGSTVYLIVGEVIWGTGGANDTVNLYAPVAPVLGDTNVTLGSVVSTYSAKNLNQANFDIVSFSNKADNLPVGIDEIRFGKKSIEVLPVPEPGTLGLLAFVGLGLVMLRRRTR